jgi:hypothetical protein
LRGTWGCWPERVVMPFLRMLDAAQDVPLP